VNVPAWPLHWPPGWKRSPFRRSAPFRVGRDRLRIRDALRRLLPELERLGADDVTISTNVKPHLYDQMGDSADPGAAVYFTLDGAPTVLACDRWDRTSDNLAAIAAHVEALRGQERWGVGSLAQAVAGYKALAAAPPARAWWEVLGVRPDATGEQIRAARRELLAKAHPDRPDGDHDQAAAINEAFQAACAQGRA